MKKLEKLKLTKPEDWEVERLSRWIYEWNLLQAAVDVTDMGDVAECLYPCLADEEKNKRYEEVMPDGGVAPMDSHVEVGQIRLMAPSGDEEMVFVAVVSIASDGVSCCVPFSPLAEPATPDELLSGRDAAVVRVLSLWNMRDVPNSIVGKSWVVDKLDASEVARLQRAVFAYKSDGYLPDDMRKDTGSQLVHPEDPRREYMNMERQRIDLALPSKIRVVESSVSYDISSQPQELLKAAEPDDPYET